MRHRSIADTVELLDEINAADPLQAMDDATELLLDQVDPRIAEAFERVADRARKHAPSDRESLRVVLEYAYRGISAQDAACHLAASREQGCPLCDSLADVERLAGLEAPEQGWWQHSAARVEYAVRCDCNEAVHGPWFNVIGSNEDAARSHLAVLQTSDHPVKLLRRTVSTGEWQEVEDE